MYHTVKICNIHLTFNLGKSFNEVILLTFHQSEDFNELFIYFLSFIHIQQ